MKQLLAAILLLVTVHVNGQVKVWMKFGDEALSEGDNYGASKFYTKAWKEDSTYAGLVYKLGLAYKGYHNNVKALKYFKKIEQDKQLQINHSDYLFHLAEINKSLENYKESKKYFEKYTRVNRDTRSYGYLKAKNELKIHGKILKLTQDTVDVFVENLGSGINTGVAEYYPVWLDDSTILYSTLRASNVTKEGVIEDESF